MKIGIDVSMRKALSGALAALAASFAAGEVGAHVFDHTVNASDAESRGNSNFASWYNWSGSARNWEVLSAGVTPERHSYALQIFDVSTRVFNVDRQIIRVSSSADAWYRKSGSNAATYNIMQSASVVINGTELLRCTSGGGCSDVRDVSLTEFYRNSKSISFGTLLGSETVTARVMGDISLDVSARSTSSKYLGIATGFLSNSIVDLVVGVHTFTRNSITGASGTSDRRLLDVDIDAHEQSRQATTLSSSTGLTTGRLTWSNREFVDVAHMDGRISYTKSSPLSSNTVVLVDVPAFFWSGQFVDNVGSTTSF